MLDTKTKNLIKNIVRKYLPNQEYQAFIFGSRVRGTNRKFSDIDLGINGPKKISAKAYFYIKSDLEDSNIPYKVDVIDFKNVSDNFKKSAFNNIITI